MTTSTIQGPDIKFSTLDEVLPYDDTDDGTKPLAHIVNPPMNLHIWTPGMEAQDVVDIARATGQEVVALCGYRWVPKRNPDKYDVCKTCMDIAGNIMRDLGE
jgi:hypothetical protein